MTAMTMADVTDGGSETERARAAADGCLHQWVDKVEEPPGNPVTFRQRGPHDRSGSFWREHDSYAEHQATCERGGGERFDVGWAWDQANATREVPEPDLPEDRP